MIYYLLFCVIWLISIFVFISFMVGARKLSNKALNVDPNNLEQESV